MSIQSLMREYNSKIGEVNRRISHAAIMHGELDALCDCEAELRRALRGCVAELDRICGVEDNND